MDYIEIRIRVLEKEHFQRCNSNPSLILSESKSGGKQLSWVFFLRVSFQILLERNSA